LYVLEEILSLIKFKTQFVTVHTSDKRFGELSVKIVCYRQRDYASAHKRC